MYILNIRIGINLIELYMFFTFFCNKGLVINYRIYNYESTSRKTSNELILLKLLICN